MSLAYILCSFGGFSGVVAVILGLIFGIKARLNLDQPVAPTLNIIARNFCLAGGVTTLLFLAISLFLD
jgi:hypothetical protein